MAAQHVIPSLPSLSAGDDRAFFTILAFSLLAHVMFFVFDKAQFISSRQPLFQEWEIEAELVSNMDFAAPDKTALPKSEQSDTAAIPKQTLPQLPKKFTLEENRKPDEEAVAEDDNAKKVEKQETAEKPLARPDKNVVEVKSDPQEANKLQMNDALRRLAIEKLREEEKLAKKMQAPDNSELARLKRDLAANDRMNAGAAGASVGAQKLYVGKLKSHVGRFWSVPDAYNFKNANLQVIISIRVNEQGHLINSSIKSASGDSVFDEMAFSAVKNSVPFPPPPKGQAGEEIELYFTPKSF